MKRRLLAMLLAALMVISALPVISFAEGETTELLMGEEDQMYVDTEVNTTWKLAGPENTALLVGEGGSYDGSYTVKRANTMALGLIVEIGGVPTDGQVQLTMDGFKAKGSMTTENMTPRTDRVTDSTKNWGAPVTADGIYAMFRLPYEWAFWEGLFYARSLDEMRIKADANIRIRVLGVVELTSNDKNLKNMNASVTYLESDQTTEIGTESATYATGIANEKSQPVIVPLSVNPDQYAREDYTEGDYNYTFTGWKDLQTDAEVAGVYGETAVYPAFSKKHKDEVTVTFVGDGGVTLDSVNVMKGSSAEYTGLAPVKSTTYDYEYYFEGWKDAEGKLVDLAAATFDTDTTLTASFIEQLRLRITMTPEKEEVGPGEAFQVALKVNRKDIYVDGKLEDITEGSIVLKYDSTLFVNERNPEGIMTVTFNSIAEDGTVATIPFIANEIRYSAGEFSATGTVSSETGKDEILDRPVSIAVVGQQNGTYFNETEAVVINQGNAETRPEKQPLWTGNVKMNTVDSVSIIYKMDGIETPINAYQLAIGFNNGADTGKGYHWFWNQADNWMGARAPRFHTFESDGYYMLFLHSRIFNGAKLNALNEIRIFDDYCKRQPKEDADETEKQAWIPVNENENATFELLAIVEGVLAPTVTFHDTDGSVLSTYEYKYITKLNTNSGVDTKQIISLVTPAEVFALAQAENADLQIPVKDSGMKEVVYEFDGWVDADGNKVEALYMSGALYPSFKMVDKRTQYQVTFKNHDGTVLYETVVREGETPVYPDNMPKPKKESTDTNSFVFNGWDPEIVMAPLTEEADGAMSETEYVYTAKFETVERRYDVSFYDEDGETWLAEHTAIVKGGKAETSVVPTKEADVQYSYEFEKWVALDGSEVDLYNITADLKVKAQYKGTLNKYTVTFLDEDDTEIGKSTVDYGTAAEAPEATKEASKWYTYDFDKWVDVAGEEVDITAVKGDMTVYASYAATFVHLFTDLEMDRFYGEAVEYCLVNGIMNGTADTAFSPNGETNRAMLVTVLYRLEGEPDISEYTEQPFTDVAGGKWYTNAIIWAYNTEVVNGISATEFKPTNPVTREQFATILYRYADEIKGYYMGCGRATLGSFKDKDEISSWAQTAIKWAIATATDTDTKGSKPYNKTQYITGIAGSDGTYMKPKNSTSRAQMATMLYRFITGEQLRADGTPVE